jgi:uncharacterized membrane protein
MKPKLAAYLSAVVVMLLLDALWLGWLARPMYLRGVGHLMAPTPLGWAAALFYVVYGLGLLRFAIAGSTHLRAAAWSGAAFGGVAYATYDLTNLATLKAWPAHLAFIDIAWGTVASSAAAVAGRMAWGRFEVR